MTEHPYRTAPAHAFWSRSVGRVAPGDVNPVVDFPFRLEPETRVATAGSCFAQHIARYLKSGGYNYFVTEPGHPMLPARVRAENNYGLFSARYGNIYTARQLLQLFQRAYGLFEPQEDCWKVADDVYVDPFRPTAQPGGFVSKRELRLDRRQHLACVRQMFEQLDVFVFTLGLTECWVSKLDGAVFPVCPGVEGGQFNPLRHAFHNETVDEVVTEMTTFLMHLARVNPRAKVILTVSPVPLAATARADQHVLVATSYSKAVLRVAAETLATRFAHVAYFPSYEIVTGNFSRGAYFAKDLRNVLEDGVSHVMRLFMKHATGDGSALSGEPSNAAPATGGASSEARADEDRANAERLVEVECDEAALDQ